MLMTVVALMMVMLAMSVAPAFAHTVGSLGCRQGFPALAFEGPEFAVKDKNSDGFVCVVGGNQVSILRS
jgi:hypothetical protein